MTHDKTLVTIALSLTLVLMAATCLGIRCGVRINNNTSSGLAFKGGYVRWGWDKDTVSYSYTGDGDKNGSYFEGTIMTLSQGSACSIEDEAFANASVIIRYWKQGTSQPKNCPWVSVTNPFGCGPLHIYRTFPIKPMYNFGCNIYRVYDARHRVIAFDLVDAQLPSTELKTNKKTNDEETITKDDLDTKGTHLL